VLEHASRVPWPTSMMLLASGVNFDLRRMPAVHVRHQPGFQAAGNGGGFGPWPGVRAGSPAVYPAALPGRGLSVVPGLENRQFRRAG